jgi:hypothetical protein
MQRQDRFATEAGRYVIGDDTNAHGFLLGCEAGCEESEALGKVSAAALALGQNSGLEALAQSSGKLVKLVLPVNLDRLPRGVQRNDTVLTFLEVQLEIRAQRCRHGVVNQIVEFGQKFRAGH